jgi:hypothetical protein
MRLFLATIALLLIVGCSDSCGAAYELRHCVDNCNIYLAKKILDKQTILKCYETCQAIANLPAE